MAKRDIAAENAKPIKSTKPPRAQQRALSEFMSFMIEQTAKRFRNQVFGELNKSTINKFEDAQIGNYAAVYLKLANRARRKLLKQFDDKRIEQMVRRILGQVDDRSRQELYKKVEQRIGISQTALAATEGLTPQINALILETSEWVKKSLDETLSAYTADSLHAMTTGASLTEILSKFDDLVAKRKNHAQFTARNQVANFHSITTKIRAQNLGIQKARWITSHDERVRHCHAVRDGKEFDLDKGLYSSCDGKTLLPGVDYQCRCTYELIIPEE